MSDQEHTRPTRETREAERREARRPASSDRRPTPDEESKAEEHSVDEDVAEHYEEMGERGARNKGEGRLP